MVNYCYLHEQAIQNNFKTPMHPYSKQISKNRNKKDITKQSLKVGNLAMSELWSIRLLPQVSTFFIVPSCSVIPILNCSPKREVLQSKELFIEQAHDKLQMNC